MYSIRQLQNKHTPCSALSNEEYPFYVKLVIFDIKTENSEHLCYNLTDHFNLQLQLSKYYFHETYYPATNVF